MRRGEIRLYRFTRPDKQRPVVILTRDSAIGVLGEVTVAPITSTIRDIPTEVVLDESNGMPRRCAANLDHVQTVPKVRIGRLLATLDDVTMREVARALAFALDMSA